MDFIGAVANFQSSQVMGELQLRAARKMLDNEQLQGSAAVKLIEAAANGVNNAGDALAAQATGLGGALDVTA